jgi:hypothetical protein
MTPIARPARAGLHGRPHPPFDHSSRLRREVSVVNANYVLHAAHDERSARLRAEADARRLAPRVRGRRLRRVVGHAIVRLGKRLAAEPAPEGLTLARSR